MDRVRATLHSHSSSPWAIIYVDRLEGNIPSHLVVRGYDDKWLVFELRTEIDVLLTGEAEYVEVPRTKWEILQ